MIKKDRASLAAVFLCLVLPSSRGNVYRLHAFSMCGRLHHTWLKRCRRRSSARSMRRL